MKLKENNEAPAGHFQIQIIRSIALLFLIFIVWTSQSRLEEVAIGEGRVIPSSQTQLIQSLEGGRVDTLLVKEGDLVEVGQVVAELDATQVLATLEDIETGIEDAQAQKIVLQTLINGDETLEFPEDFKPTGLILKQKLSLFDEMKSAQDQGITDLKNELELLQKEMEIVARASQRGGATEIERLRLNQKIASANTSLNSRKLNFRRDTQVDLDEVNRELQQLEIRKLSQKDLLKNTEIRSPRSGTIQKIYVSTAGGGVVPPNGTVMEIVPLEDKLLIEARFSPRDIAFIAPQQLARIKVTAYDFSIFGGLEATVLRVSPDSFQDETKNGEYYFAVTLESERTYFETGDERRHPIIPGMVTTTEIVTGERTILQYLLKPLRKASEALRER